MNNDFNFDNNKLSQISKAQEIKQKFDGILIEFLTNGYNESLYDKAYELKMHLSFLDQDVVKELGLNVQVLEIITNKHDEEIKKLESRMKRS